VVQPVMSGVRRVMRLDVSLAVPPPHRADVCPPLQVIQGDVDEALRLMSMSKNSLEDEEQQQAVTHDPIRDAFSKVRTPMHCRARKGAWGTLVCRLRAAL
jgi:hypothetical protein